MRVAVIIPTLEDEALPRLLARLVGLDPPAEEVIVVDGAGSQACELACRGAGALWIPAHSGRGGQLALGAARAQADVLWFLHPDCEPPAAAIAAIGASVARGAAGGYFRFRFSGPPSPFKSFLERCIAWRSRFGTVYGDQGIFVTRAAYHASPGFALQPLFEERELVRALKRSRRFVALGLPLLVSPRRWERDGYLKRTLADRLLVLGFLCGISAARLARWQGRRRRPVPARSGRSRRSSTSSGHEAHER
jgi:glycosyltransferase involved in cell wall biosynthesis